MKVFITRLARADVSEITRYVHRQGAPMAAKRLRAEISAACASLDSFPERYERAPEYGDELRRLVLGNYLIFYRVHETRVEVVEVRDGRRKPRRLGR